MPVLRHFIVAVKVGILVAELKNYNIYIASIQETK